MISNLTERFKAAAFIAAFIAAGFSVIAVVLWLAGGGAKLQTRDVNLLEIVALYFGGAFIGGTIIAILWPLHRRLAGAVILGWLGAFPCYLGALWLLAADEWGGTAIAATAGIALLTGGGAGGSLWWEYIRPKSRG